VRVAFNDEYRDSFYHVSGPYTGDPGLLRESSARVSLLWQPLDALRILFKADYNYIDQGGYPADPANSTAEPFHITNNAHNMAIDQFGRAVLNVSYTFADGIALRSISGYQRGRTSEAADLDGTSSGPLTFRDSVDERIYSEELNLLSPGDGPLTWILGAYYQNNTYDFPPGQFDIGLPPGVFDYVLGGKNPEETEAGFGQISYDLPHGLQIQVGARYSYSHTHNKVEITYPEFGVLLPDEQSEHDSQLTGKVALNWKLNDSDFLYAFVATGHKPGGLNVPSDLTLPPVFGPEDVTDYELGWKRTSFNGHLKTQLGGYYNDYRHFQVTTGSPLNATIKLEQNVPSNTRLYGLEAQAQALFGPVSVDLGASVLRSKLGAFYAADNRLANPPTPCDAKTGPASPACQNLTGFEQDYAPKFTFNIGAQYIYSLGQGQSLTPRVSYSHIAAQWATLFEDPVQGDRLEERNLVNAQLAYQNGDWVVTAYGSNLTDQHYVGAINSSLRFFGPPRQFGLRVMKSF
jgi:iron complex outermembrane receptor protein